MDFLAIGVMLAQEMVANDVRDEGHHVPDHREEGRGGRVSTEVEENVEKSLGRKVHWSVNTQSISEVVGKPVILE